MKILIGANVACLEYVLAHLAPVISLKPFLEIIEEFIPE